MATGDKKKGVRKRYRGKMVGPDGIPRSMGGISKIPGKTKNGQPVYGKSGLGLTKNPVFELNQKGPVPTKNLPGEFKVQMPKGRIRYVK